MGAFISVSRNIIQNQSIRKWKIKLINKIPEKKMKMWIGTGTLKIGSNHYLRCNDAFWDCLESRV